MKNQLESQLEGTLWKCGILFSRNHEALFGIESPVRRIDGVGIKGWKPKWLPQFLIEDFVLLILSTLGSTVLETLVHKERDTLLPQSQQAKSMNTTLHCEL